MGKKEKAMECCEDFIDMENENAQLVKSFVMKRSFDDMSKTLEYGMEGTQYPKTQGGGIFWKVKVKRMLIIILTVNVRLFHCGLLTEFLAHIHRVKLGS
ncbi:hypothetical protein NPIL_618451 [Nephila pilipes]|uniref:Uncharacterized protein n=1 Tax=Nephila pilipes TaxID=299642 RepID=A0A8X6MEP6_NEPPI|nr:hypothetical protein NPIL_618451 [Nephila pilipes]